MMVKLDIRGLIPLIQVFDMATALDFYGRILGFEIVDKAGPPGDIGWAWLRCAEAQVMLNTAYESHERPATPDFVRTRAHRDTILFIGCPDVDAAHVHLKSHGIVTEPPKVAPYGMRQLYLHDRDGYGICFQWPVDA
jgi:glyoxylase I family protein